MNRALKTAGRTSAAILALSLAAPAAEAATFPFQVINASWIAATLGGTNYLGTIATDDVAISGVLVGAEVSTGLYQVTGIQDFTVTTSDASLQSAIDALRLVDETSTPAGALQISWDGLDPFDWSYSGTFGFTAGEGLLNEALVFLATGVVDWQLSGFGDPGTGSTSVNIEASGDLEAGAAVAPVPLPAGLALLPVGLAGLWMAGRRRRAA